MNWLNDEQLALLNTDANERIVTLDPLRDEVRSISFSELPNFSNSIRQAWIEIDPTLTRVLYPVKGSSYSLIALDGLKSFATLSAWTAEVPDASWTRNGGSVAVVGTSPKYFDNHGGSDELYVISRDGNVDQITHLADTFGKSIWLHDPRWSPDGNRLAFWIQNGRSGAPGYVLATVDLASKSVIDLCVSSDPSGLNCTLEARHETRKPPCRLTGQTPELVSCLSGF